MQRGYAESISLTNEQIAELRLAELDSVRQHGFKDRLQLARRAGDDPQHLRGRGLLLQRFGKVPPRLGELTGARLKLLLQLARVRLELLFRRRLRFLRPAEMTHAGHPQAEDPPIRA